MRLQAGENAWFNYRAAGILIDGGRVLLHHNKRGDWALPGGHIEFGEDASSTLVREMQEELAVQVTVERLVWISEHFFQQTGSPVRWHEAAYYFEISLVDGHPLLAREGEFTSEEGPRLHFAWHALSVLAELNLYPTFLRDGLAHLPAQTTHLVTRETPASP